MLNLPLAILSLYYVMFVFFQFLLVLFLGTIHPQMNSNKLFLSLEQWHAIPFTFYFL